MPLFIGWHLVFKHYPIFFASPGNVYFLSTLILVNMIYTLLFLTLLSWVLTIRWFRLYRRSMKYNEQLFIKCASHFLKSEEL